MSRSKNFMTGAKITGRLHQQQSQPSRRKTATCKSFDRGFLFATLLHHTTRFASVCGVACSCRKAVSGLIAPQDCSAAQRMEQPPRHTSCELACPGGIVPSTSRSSASRSSIGRSDSAATGARRNAAAVRTKMHSVIVIARMIVRALKLARRYACPSPSHGLCEPQRAAPVTIVAVQLAYLLFPSLATALPCRRSWGIASCPH